MRELEKDQSWGRAPADSSCGLEAQIREREQAAQDLATAIGLAPEAKYDLLPVMFGAASSRAPASSRTVSQRAAIVPLIKEPDAPLLGDEFWSKLERTVWKQPTPESIAKLRVASLPDGESTPIDPEEQFAAALNAAAGRRPQGPASILAAAESLATAGVKALNRHNHEQAEALLNQASKVLDSGGGGAEWARTWAGDKSGEWRLQLARVRIDQVTAVHRRGDVKAAIDLARENLAWIQKNSDLLYEHVRLLVWLAELENPRGYPDQAWIHLQEAHDRLQREIARTNASHSLLRAHIARVEGSVMIRQGKWGPEEAIAAFERSHELAKAAEVSRRDRMRLEMLIERDRCRLLIRQGRLEDALGPCERSYELGRKLFEGPRAVAIYFAHVADIYRSGREEAEARLRHAVFSALSGFENLDDDLDQARMHLRLARLYRKDQHPWDARYWADRAVKFGMRTDMPLFLGLARRQYGLALEMESDLSPDMDAQARTLLIEEAQGQLRESVNLLATLQDGFEHAVSQRALGAMLARRARVNAIPNTLLAREPLEAARATFARLGAEIELRKTDETLGFIADIERRFGEVAYGS